MGPRLSRTSVGFCLNQDGGVRRYGSADLEIPFPLLCMRPMADGLEGLRGGGAGGAESAEVPTAQPRLCPVNRTRACRTSTRACHPDLPATPGQGLLSRACAATSDSLHEALRATFVFRSD